MSRINRFLVTALFIVSTASFANGQVRLLGITGNKEDDQQLFPDETLFELNLTNGSATKLLTMTPIPDTDAIGFNPSDGLLYRVSGAESYSNNPTRRDVGIGFRDNQYMETLNLQTNKLSAVFNANPPDSPDEVAAFGLPAPRPAWIAPAAIRLFDDVDQSFRERGEDEYHALRDLTWSNAKGLFYGTDENGIFTLTPGGVSKFLAIPDTAAPGEIKALSFVKVGEETRLMLGERHTGNLWTINPDTGLVIGNPLALAAPPGGATSEGLDDEFGGLVGLDQHPETGVLYGVRNVVDPAGDSVAFTRELVTINPTTGATQYVGNIALHIAGIAFVSPSQTAIPGDFNKNGSLDEPDITLLSDAVVVGTDLSFDLSKDGKVDQEDRRIWVEDLKRTYFGDSNFDGEFNSGDFVEVFQRGEYEDNTDDNSTWIDGDWNGNRDFESGDFVSAFQAGGYEIGPRPPIQAVPEPSSLVLILMTGLVFLGNRRR